MTRKIAFETKRFGWREPYAQGIILIISAAVVVVWVLTKPIVFTQDSITYINAARELELGQSTGGIFSRLPAFPAVLWAFHVTDLKHSVFWLILFQACLAVGSSWLFYLTARLLAPRGAFVLSLVFIASLLPFVQVKHIMTEQIFFFETMLTLFGMVAYLLARTSRGAWLAVAVLGVGAALMTLTRPQGAYIVPVVFGLVGVLAWRRAWFAFVGAIVVVGAVWSIQIVDQRARSVSQRSAGSFDSSHMTGKMFLFTFYLDGSSRANIRIAPENGPKTAELKALLLDEFVKPDTLARRRGYLVSVAPQDVPRYVERMFSEPNSEFYTLLAFASLDDRLGSKETNRLLLQVCLEAALAYPVPTARLFIEKGLEIYFNPWMLSVPLHPTFFSGYFQSALADEVAAAGDYTTPTSADLVIDQNIRWLMRIAILVAVITLPIALRYPTWRVTIALLVLGLYLNVAVVVGNSPLFRYAIYAIPVNLLCGYAGAVAVLSALGKRYLKKSVVVNGRPV
jgi:hypothetical protein